ncbi:MAG: transposase [Thermodesulfobacteriota bacterium]
MTFSCYHRRRLLDHDRCKQAVIAVLSSELVRQEADCLGFVVMPDHVHAMLHVSKAGLISMFMKQWKQRSSVQIKRLLSTNLINYSAKFRLDEPVW